MADFVTFGDAEAAVCAIIRADTNLSTIADLTVSTDLVGWSAGRRWVRVTRTGGMPILWMRMDNPTIGVDVYAPSKAAAYDLATGARAAVFAACGAYTGHGLTVFDVADSVGLTWAPDDKDGPRYTFALSLFTRPVPEEVTP